MGQRQGTAHTRHLKTHTLCNFAQLCVTWCVNLVENAFIHSVTAFAFMTIWKHDLEGPRGQDLHTFDCCLSSSLLDSGAGASSCCEPIELKKCHKAENSENLAGASATLKPPAWNGKTLLEVRGPWSWTRTVLYWLALNIRYVDVLACFSGASALFVFQNTHCTRLQRNIFMAQDLPHLAFFRAHACQQHSSSKWNSCSPWVTKCSWSSVTCDKYWDRHRSSWLEQRKKAHGQTSFCKRDRMQWWMFQVIRDLGIRSHPLMSSPCAIHPNPRDSKVWHKGFQRSKGPSVSSSLSSLSSVPLTERWWLSGQTQAARRQPRAPLESSTFEPAGWGTSCHGMPSLPLTFQHTSTNWTYWTCGPTLLQSEFNKKRIGLLHLVPRLLVFVCPPSAVRSRKVLHVQAVGDGCKIDGALQSSKWGLWNLWRKLHKSRHFHINCMFVFSFRSSHHIKVTSILSNTCPFVVPLNLTTSFPACFQSVNAIGTNCKTIVAWPTQVFHRGKITLFSFAATWIEMQTYRSVLCLRCTLADGFETLAQSERCVVAAPHFFAPTPTATAGKWGWSPVTKPMAIDGHPHNMVMFDCSTYYHNMRSHIMLADCWVSN